MTEVAKDGTDQAEVEARWRRVLVAEYLEAKKLPTPLAPSLKRELELIADGYLTSKEAANKTGRSPATIQALRKKLYKLLDVDGKESVVQALLSLALKHLDTRSLQ